MWLVARFGVWVCVCFSSSPKTYTNRDNSVCQLSFEQKLDRDLGTNLTFSCIAVDNNGGTAVPCISSDILSQKSIAILSPHARTEFQFSPESVLVFRLRFGNKVNHSRLNCRQSTVDSKTTMQWHGKGEFRHEFMKRWQVSIGIFSRRPHHLHHPINVHYSHREFL